jgi:hypothetical protein
MAAKRRSTRRSTSKTITVHHKSGSLRISVKVVPKRKSGTKKKTRRKLYGAAAKAHAKKVARRRRRRS